MRLFNSLTKTKEEFTPLQEGKVKIYVCGITSYDYCHIGHARSAVVFDVLVRYLRHCGYDVTFVRNFTDVDDKIIVKANREGKSCTEISEKYIAAFYEDMDKLHVLRADIEPKATEHIQEMIELISRLIDKGHAYAAENGDVYFRVRSYAKYGELSGRKIDDLLAGARIAPGEKKDDPLDFALWKGAKPGEPSWESPWGPGRPGWHIECSAMSRKYIDMPFDIHGGGQDLAFPHHENERAQSEAACDTQFARYWVHNGFVQINSEKMSKSLNNFITIRDILTSYLPEVLRFFLLTKHYRSPLDYSTEGLEEAEKAIKRIYQTRQAVATHLAQTKWKQSELPPELLTEFETAATGWQDTLEDDLNTAAALGHIFSIVRICNRILEDKTLRQSRQSKHIFQTTGNIFRELHEILGLFEQSNQDFLTSLRESRARRKSLDLKQIEGILEKRAIFRAQKDFELADALREELKNMDIEVQDTPQGQIWDVI